MDAREVAKTIQDQLMGTLGQAVVWSWGQHGLQSVTGEQAEDLGIECSRGALKFNVNGYLHKGHVLVSLNGADTYDVFICNISKGKMKIKEKIEGIYFEEFGSWIDNQVEQSYEETEKQKVAAIKKKKKNLQP